MYRLVLIIFSAFALLGSPALAKDARSNMWIVSQLSGDARVVRSGLQPVSLKAKAELAPGDIITTGASGRATLARGADYIVMAPRSEMRLPSAAQPNGFTRVIQNLGTMLFKIQHTGVPHFAVDTPMLAAVVKGTTFTVIVDKDRSAVQVIEGAVEVRAADGGMARLVEGGRTVFIDHDNPKMLIDADLHSPDTAATSSSAVRISSSAIPSLTEIANLTGGLVHPAPTPQPTGILTAPTLALMSPTSAVTAPGTSAPTVTTPVVTEPVVDVVEETVEVAEPVVDTKETVTVVEPVADVVEETLELVEPVVEPVVGVVEDTVAVVEPVVDIVEETVEVIEPVVEQVVDIVEETVAVIEPVVDIVEETVEVIEPVVNVVETTVPTVTEPIVDIVEATIPVVTEPVVDIVTVPTVPVPLLPGL